MGEKMKKRILIVFLGLILSLSVFSGCAKKINLSDYICELKEKIYFGETDDYKVTCGFGFIVNENSQKITGLTFKVKPTNSLNAKRSLEIILDGKTFNKDLTVSLSLYYSTCFIEKEDLKETEFNVKIKTGSDIKEITLKEENIEGTIDYKTALNCLIKNQPDLIESYKENNVFMGKIIIRKIIRNERSFWYVGLIDKNDNLKALLIDGKTGDVLAIRKII